MSTRISCVIPVYNGERYLAAAIESVLRQTHSAVEIIVIDDGSTDGTPEVLAGVGDRITVARQENAGASAARNHGTALARGDVIAFLDADDLFLPHKLGRQASHLDAVPGLALSAAQILDFWSPDLPEAERDHDTPRLTPWPGHLCTWAVRSEVFSRVGGFDENLPLSQDVDWHLRAREAGTTMQTLPDILSLRRLHAGNRTRHASDECRRVVVESVKALLDRRRGRHV